MKTAQALDFQAIAGELLPQAHSLLKQWLPAGKLHGREYKVGSLAGEPGESLCINIDTGLYSDFSTGESGKDLIALYAAINKCTQSQAALQLSGNLELQSEEEFVIGEICKSFPSHKHGKPKEIYEYKTAEGKLYGYVCRFEPLNEGKQFAPLTCWRKSNNRLIWKWKKWPIDSQPYGIEFVNPDSKILVVEGEKATHAARELLPQWVILSWAGGASAVKKTDWSALENREVFIWPDADPPGQKAAETLKAVLPALNIVALPPDLPQGWDLADAKPDFPILDYLKKQAPQIIEAKKPSLDRNKLFEFIEAINEEYALVLRGSQVLIMRYWTGEDNVSRLTFLSVKDFQTLLANQQIWSDADKKFLPVAPLWLKSPMRAQYEDVYFKPCDKEYKLRYNLWRGFAVLPDNSKGQHDLFLKHIEENICSGNEEHYNWVIDWLAHLIQKPYQKPGTAIVLRGEMGTGKGFFANAVGKLFGQHYIPILHGGQLTSRFNSHLADKVLVFVDESGWSQDKYGAGIIRGMITEPYIAIEMKGKDVITMENYGHFIIAANSEWAVPTSMQDERRWAVFDVGSEHKGDKKYFAAISKQLENGGYESLLYFLQHHKYDEITARTIPQTEALMAQKIRSMPDEVTWWHECLMYGEIGDFQLNDDNNNFMPCKTFYSIYLKWCENMRRQPLADNILPKNLRNFVSLDRKLKYTMEGREWNYHILPLTDLRMQFEKQLGHFVDWPKED